MKKLLLVIVLILSNACVFAQGTIVFNNRVPGVIVTHVYAPLSSDPTFHQIGNGSADTPVGTQDWTAFSLIGAGESAANTARLRHSRSSWASMGITNPSPVCSQGFRRRHSVLVLTPATSPGLLRRLAVFS